MSAPRLTGNRCQCPTCNEYFNGVAGFDAHRIGPYDDTRRCLTVAEMIEHGWYRNRAGFWVTDSKPQRAARHSAAGAQDASSPVGAQRQGGSV